MQTNAREITFSMVWRRRGWWLHQFVSWIKLKSICLLQKIKWVLESGH